MYLRKRASTLWNPVTDPVLSDISVFPTMELGGQVPHPILQDAQLLSIPFNLKDVVHPNIPKSIKAKRKWTDVQREVIKSNRPKTIRCTAEFFKEVSVLCICQIDCMLTTVHICRWMVFLTMVWLQAINSFACQGHSSKSILPPPIMSPSTYAPTGRPF